MPSYRIFAAASTVALFALSNVRVAALSSSAPINYTGIPDGDYSTEWQQYFQVSNDDLGLNFSMGTSYAGNIKVDRDRHDNDTLFFWAFEKENGSLTANSSDPWAVWLQGGPGTSSLYGLFTENGPMLVEPNTNTLTENDNAWNKLIDYIWVDQPVGVGYSTADSTGYVNDEDQVGSDFVGFLSNLVQVFPNLATRPFYLTGESYAGRYIPYIAKALFSTSNPPVKLSKIMVGDPAFGSNNEFKTMPTLSLIETYPQLIAYDTDVYDYFQEQAHLCGLDLNLSYPQTGGNFPSINLVTGQNQNTTTNNPDDDEDSDEDSKKANGSSNNSNNNNKRAMSSRGFYAEVKARYYDGERLSLAQREEKRHKRDVWKRDLTGRANGSIDSWYGCFVWDEMVDYAVNFTYPWNVSQEFDTFDVPDALNPDVSIDPSFFLNNNTVRKAIHAPTQDWTSSVNYPWGSQDTGSDPSPEPMVFFDELATNMTNNGVDMVIYVGNDDGISPHFGTEVTIQNTTFGATQGFTRRPGTPWWDDDGQWAGIIHQERNWTYALIYGTGHEVPAGRPAAAYTFVREFLLGTNQAGLVQNSSGSAIVVGGENPTLQQSAIPGQSGIAYGSTTTQGQTTWPSATVAAFESHVGFVAVTGTNAIKPSATSSASSLTPIGVLPLLGVIISWTLSSLH
ncbi:hypothetical protein NM688_g5322 [Phlebia brevispora]|uniref:Uncharacterized protein n=1 Tax=Phlebia brevispora TaxID=194682 RepID=A0ACC1SXC9_9APHY|nr:hypothetical protein NM688_g5322 [Phlebia brevispora]